MDDPCQIAVHGLVTSRAYTVAAIPGNLADTRCHLGAAMVSPHTSDRQGSARVGDAFDNPSRSSGGEAC